MVSIFSLAGAGVGPMWLTRPAISRLSCPETPEANAAFGAARRM